LQTPDYEQVIVENLSLSVQPGQGLLIVGPSGRGKSSLLRAIAGLWNAGTGRLVRPPLEEVLFLPQRPYIILGTLREQLLYPNRNQETNEIRLREVLQEVNLQNLLNRVNSFDTEEPWENILSLGEQQRLAFARVLITRPSFTILDEATSALDLNNEENLYRQLQKTHTTFISVGHRESLFNYHQWVLELSSNSHWQLLTVEEYRRQKVKEIINISVDNSQDRLEDLPNQETEVNPKINSAGEPPPESPTTTILTEVEEGLSHAQMKELSDYSLSSIRSKASQGKSITGKDGLTYRYDKDPKILKWLRV
jgi:putative ATP-binding cassette transporter